MQRFDIEPTGSGGAVIVRPGVPIPVGDVGTETLIGWIAAHGVVVLRGFQIDQQRFSAFVEGCSSRTTFDPSREFHGGHSQLVNVGNKEIDLHCENGNGPWRPDLAWFYCQRAAAHGGHTTTCDGVRLWNELSPQIRELFRTRRIRYCRTTLPERWRVFVPSLLPGRLEPSRVTVEHLKTALTGIPGISYRVLPDESVYSEYECSAVYRTKFGGEEAFANSMRGPYSGQQVKMDDGSPVPTAALEDVIRTGDRLTEPIRWADGDLAVVDNTRVLHGRTRFSDPDRRIFVALSFA